MNFIEDEIPSDNESVNSVKSLKIKNLNKLLNEKGNSRLNDAELFITYRTNEHLQPLLYNSSHAALKSNCEKQVLDNKPQISSFKLNPNINRVSGFKHSCKKQKVMDSRDILANLWKELENKHNNSHENISDDFSSISD